MRSSISIRRATTSSASAAARPATRAARAICWRKLCLDLGLSDHEVGETNEADKLALTTADRKFTVRTVACFGQCALAPVVEVNHHILSHVNERTLQREIKALDAGEKIMPRIQDIGSFNAVRESGLAKLMPAVPRITVGMGTCGRGNGAEEVFHALNGAIQGGGLDVQLTGVGCFGSCFQEPLVGVRLPGCPLVMLHRVQAHDAGRILESVSTGVMPPDLIYCKIEEWDHITGIIKYGQGYPEIAPWNALPFFKGQKKIVLRNCGLINPSDIEEYIAVGGYQALYKVLIDGRKDAVIEQIKAARLRGRGGAGFLTGNKWDFLAKAKSDVKYIICNADEGDPGAYMNRNEIEGDPHSLLEGMIIGAYVDGRHRRHHLRARRVSAGRAPPHPRHRAGARIRPARQQHSRPRLQLQHRAGAGRRRICLRRRDSPHRLARRLRRPSASAPAVPRAEGPVGQAHQHQQRRNLVQHRAHRQPRRSLVC